MKNPFVLFAALFWIGVVNASLRGGRELKDWKYVCLDTGDWWGPQTFEVDQPKFRWITRESQGAERDECPDYPEDLPPSGQRNLVKVCKQFGGNRGERCRVYINKFAEDWFLDLDDAWPGDWEECDDENIDGPDLYIEWVHPDDL